MLREACGLNTGVIYFPEHFCNTELLNSHSTTCGPVGLLRNNPGHMMFMFPARVSGLHQPSCELCVCLYMGFISLLLEHHFLHSVVIRVRHSLVEGISLPQNLMYGFKSSGMWNSAMSVTSLVFHTCLHCRNRIRNACRYFICKSVRHFDSPTILQHNMGSATSPDSVQEELNQVTAVKLDSLAHNLITASKRTMVFYTFFCAS